MKATKRRSFQIFALMNHLYVTRYVKKFKSSYAHYLSHEWLIEARPFGIDY